MIYLGLDYGTAKIGVALATGPLAEPLATFDTKSSIKKIKELIVKLQIEKIIIGKPDKSLSFEFEKFVNLLNPDLIGSKLKIVDETLSSHDARLALLHTTQTRRKEKEHSVAAAIILQSWLDYHH
ncbi:MAG: Holliday junction resolvase RuvX [Patescibacteria group bacterium]